MMRSRRLMGLAVLAAALIGLVAIYVKGTGPGNGEAAECAAALDLAGRLEPLARGEVAAFQPAERAEYLADIAFSGPDGATLGLADFSGRVILVNLWATWCVPCREEMPALDRLAEAFAGDDFALVAIDADPRDKERSREFLTEIGTSNIAYHADEGRSVFNALKARGLLVGLPTTILVDRAGCSLGVMSGPSVWDSADAKALIGAAVEVGTDASAAN